MLGRELNNKNFVSGAREYLAVLKFTPKIDRMIV
jgi:hypothetical protein